MKNFWNVDCIPWPIKIKIRIRKQTSTPQTIKADIRTHEGFCSRSMLQAHFARVSTHEGAFSSSLNLPRELAPKYLTCLISWSILRGGNSALEDEVYPWNRWYTRRSFPPGACPWSMLRGQNPSYVSAFNKFTVAVCGLVRTRNRVSLIVGGR